MPVAAAVATVATGVYTANKASKATKEASKTQAESADAGIAERRRQFDAIQELMQPYVQAGTGALGAQQNLIGLGGADAQQQAIQAMQESPEFQSLTQQGEDAILANASATGGLRGGNTQAALAQFRPQVLAQMINQQYSRLGGLTSLGQNAAAGVGNAGMATGNSIANLLQQQGAATAGGQIAAGQAAAGYGNALMNGLGTYVGLGGTFGSTAVSPSAATGAVGGGGFKAPSGFGW